MDKLSLRVATLYQAAKSPKVSPTQVRMLKAPGRIRPKPPAPPNAAIKKLIDLELLALNDSNPDWSYYTRTEKGDALLEELKRDKTKMSPEEVMETVRIFQRLRIETKPNVDWGVVDLTLRDPSHGNTTVERVDTQPSEAEAKRIVKEMQRDLKERARETRQRWRHIPR